MAEYLEYDGQWLTWHTGVVGPPWSVRATSGMKGHQMPAEQCKKDAGPVPEGNYYLRLKVDPRDYARHDGTTNCALVWSPLIQRIPRGGDPALNPTRTRVNTCERWWANWGDNRVRFEPADTATRNRCTPRRSGFYLHDSTKGFSHGCIEVERKFFVRLRTYVAHTIKKRLSLVVKYAYTTTYGGTKSP